MCARLVCKKGFCTVEAASKLYTVWHYKVRTTVKYLSHGNIPMTSQLTHAYHTQGSFCTITFAPSLLRCPVIPFAGTNGGNGLSVSRNKLQSSVQLRFHRVSTKAHCLQARAPMENSPVTRPITFDSNGTRVEHEHVMVRRISFALNVTSCYSHPLLPVPA